VSSKRGILRKGRAARLALAALVLFSALLAGGVLFAKHKLETLRAAVIGLAEAKTGAAIAFRVASISGFRSVRVEDVTIRYVSANDISVVLDVPEIYFVSDLGALLKGAAAVSQIEIRQARLQVDMPAESEKSLASSRFGLELSLPFSSFFPLRVTGKDCSVELRNLPGGASLPLDRVEMDLSYSPASGVVSGTLGASHTGWPDSRWEVELIRFASSHDFDVRAESRTISMDEIRDIAPGFHATTTGQVSVSQFRVSSDSDRKLIMLASGLFDSMIFQTPKLSLPPLNGAFRLNGEYDTLARRFQVTSAHVSSDMFDAEARGEIAHQEDSSPTLDFHVRINKAALATVANQALQEAAKDYGSTQLTMDDPVTGEIAVSASLKDPIIQATLRASGGALAFEPGHARWPTASVQMGLSEFRWHSQDQKLDAQIAISNGSIQIASQNIAVTKIAGMLLFDGRHVKIAPLSAEVTGNPWWGNASFDTANRSGRLAFNGTLSRIEATPLFAAIKDTEISGSGSLNGVLTFDPAAFDVQAAVDATQTQVAYEWWYRKPPGIGAIGSVTAHITPRAAATIDADLMIVNSPVKSHMEMKHNGRQWVLMATHSTSERLDIGTVGQCLAIPYKVTGGTATAASYDWVRESHDPPIWHATMACAIDAIDILPVGGRSPIAIQGAALEGTVTKGPDTGSLSIKAEHASMPSFGDHWFNPMRPDDPALAAKFPPDDREWEYTLLAKTLTLPPWKGTDFTGEAYLKDQSGGLRHFSAAIDEGRLSGSYRNNSIDNAYETVATWNDVPVHFFLEHLKFPDALNGNISGNVTYGMDRDDPATLRGQGAFEISNGRFNADYILSQLQSRMSGEEASIPASLAFSTLKSDVLFENDRVITSNVELLSKGVKISGNGGFVHGGDMDYSLGVSISPQVAEQIPAIRDSITVQGHRLAQQNIELTFNVTGPTFRPHSEVAGVPAISVTLVSGALAVTSELIDFPRKILVELLKIGGGIISVGR